MNFANFISSLNDKEPPGNMSIHLQALWFDANENWKKAHEIVQNINDKNASWIHAYLHRKEGDLSNSAYWYSKASKEMSKLSLKEEWTEITKFLIEFD